MNIAKRILLIALAAVATACGQSPPCDPAATTMLQGTVYDCRDGR
jgi:hypothetical protein